MFYGAVKNASYALLRGFAPLKVLRRGGKALDGLVARILSGIALAASWRGLLQALRQPAMPIIEQDGLRGRLDRLVALRIEAEVLRTEYRAVFRDRSIPHAEQREALSTLTGEMGAVLTEAQALVYG